MNTYSKFSRFFSAIILGSVVTASLGGCDVDYWWSRGQPPSTEKLLKRSEQTFSEVLSSHEKGRASAVPAITAARDAVKSLAEASRSGDQDVLSKSVSAAESAFLQLEGKLYVTSRVPFSELSGQLRVIRDKVAAGQKPEFDSVGLFAARTIFLLSSDLEMPDPSSVTGE